MEELRGLGASRGKVKGRVVKVKMDFDEIEPGYWEKIYNKIVKLKEKGEKIILVN